MKTKIMGILNLTPDSFYPASRVSAADALERALRMIEQGANIIDIGGESTRPDSQIISATEELNRVIPIIKQLSKETSIPISIDSYKPEVVELALGAGATIINDITGMRKRSMRKLASQEDCEVVIMHMQEEPRTMQKSPHYQNVVNEILEFLQRQINMAENDGIKPEKIIIDPGIGFGKTTGHNIEILRNLDKFQKPGKRILIGASRKAFIGRILGTENDPVPPEERLNGSLAVAAHCALREIDILRVHDVKETAQVLKFAEMLR